MVYPDRVYSCHSTVTRCRAFANKGSNHGTSPEPRQRCRLSPTVNAGQDRFESVTFSLYVNGFAFSTLDGREAGTWRPGCPMHAPETAGRFSTWIQNRWLKIEEKGRKTHSKTSKVSTTRQFMLDSLRTWAQKRLNSFFAHAAARRRCPCHPSP